MGISEKINQILADWNPIDVPKHLVHQVYKQYVEIFLTLETDDLEFVFKELEQIALNISTYDPTNEIHKIDLESIANRIYLELSK